MDGTAVAQYSTLCGLLSYSLWVARRSLQAVDVVVGSVENQTAEFVAVVGEAASEVAQAVGAEGVRVVEAVGSQTVNAVPVVSAVLLTLLLLGLRNIVARLWYSRKETMKRQGETPEGNLAQPHALDEVEASPFPYLPWLDMAMLTAVGANLEDGLTL